MRKEIVSYPLHEVVAYINWIYFFHAWGFQPKYATVAEIHGCEACRGGWIASFPEAERPKATEALKLFKDANEVINLLDATYKTHAACRLCVANSDGDNLILDGVRLPLLRQQIVKKSGDPYLCLSDFVRPASSGIADTVGVFATTVDAAMEHLYEDDPYKRMLVQTLADRLAEATAEYFHEQVRKTIWGYVPDENLSMKDLLIENYQGIRPAIGYPSLPDQSLNFILDK